MEKVYEFKILHEGWEMDNLGWIMKDPTGRHILMTTSHDGPYEMPKHELEEKIQETENSLRQLKKAKKLMEY